MNKTIGIALDDETKRLLDEFGAKRGLCRSAAARLAIREFFINRGEKK